MLLKLLQYYIFGTKNYLNENDYKSIYYNDIIIVNIMNNLNSKK